MANFKENELLNQDFYLKRLILANQETQFRLTNGDGEYDIQDASGLSYDVDVRTLSPTGSPVKTFGPVSLNENWCQIPTSAGDAPFPKKIVLPKGSRKEIALGPYKYRDKSGTKGLVALNENHFSFNYPGQNFFDPKFAYYMEKLYLELCPKLGVKKIHITSGFRSPAYQRAGRKTNPNFADISPHCAGWAVDICISNDDRFVVADAAYYMGFGGIAMGKNFVHIDINAYARWNYPAEVSFKYISPSQHKG
jgi:hypothetical protein